MQPSELVKAAMEKASIPSTRALAKELNVSQSSVSLWMNDERLPEFENAAALAELAGLPPTRTAASIRLNSPKNSRRVNALLKKIISNAAIVVLATMYTNGKCETLQVSTNHFLHNCGIVYKGGS